MAPIGMDGQLRPTYIPKDGTGAYFSNVIWTLRTLMKSYMMLSYRIHIRYVCNTQTFYD